MLCCLKIQWELLLLFEWLLFFFHLPKMLMCPSQVLAVFFAVEPVWSSWPAVLLRGLCVCFHIVYLHHLKWLVARVCVTLPPAWDHCRGPTTLNTLATFQTLWYDSLWRGVAAPPLMVCDFFFFPTGPMTDTTAHLLPPANVTAWIRGINKHKKKRNNEPYITAQPWVAFGTVDAGLFFSSSGRVIERDVTF